MLPVVYNLKDYFSEDCFCVSIGVFDGVHIGHRKILNANYEGAKSMKCKFGVLTFIKRYNSGVYSVTTLEHRIRLLKECGCEKVFIINDNDMWFFNLSAEMFIMEVLKKRLKCKGIYVGEDFKFGKERSADVLGYKDFFENNGIKANIIEFEKINGKKISSSKIRNLLRDLNFGETEKYLGRKYSFGGIIVKGEGLGSKMGIKTANIKLNGCRLPFEGVFSCRVRVEDIKKVFKGVLSIGKNPTVSHTNEQKAEVHIINFDKDIYGKFVEVFPKKKIRDVIRFPSVDALKQEIEKDINIVIKENY